MRQAGGKQGRRTFTGDERADWVSRFRSSGLTQPEFAREHGLKLGTLQRWLYGRGAHGGDESGSRRSPPMGIVLTGSIERLSPFTGSRGARRAQPFGRSCCRLSVRGRAGWAAEVTWPSGVTVRFGAGAEAAWIGAVLDVVRQAC